MKVYELEFSFFCGTVWRQVTVEIIAISKIQLMREFLKQIKYISQYSLEFDTKKEAVKHCWNWHKKYIKEKELTFPIVNSH
jgi:hypothetical protein